jgi:hypothetical protein
MGALEGFGFHIGKKLDALTDAIGSTGSVTGALDAIASALGSEKEDEEP